MYKNSWKGLIEEILSKNSTKTIRSSALDSYELIVESAFGFINYHLIKILNYQLVEETKLERIT